MKKDWRAAVGLLMIPAAYLCYLQASAIRALALVDIRCGTHVMPDGTTVHYEFCGPHIPEEYDYYMIGFYASALTLAIMLVWIFLKPIR